ncbi:LPS assembly lipoprotein LptE [uncultured Photobacterium sp.]|uniref:LPS-assembly lipoprotein LptE n=1 Tax=uncultured Photobacterium sp. TaxID=173973 RepID=UPI0026318E20|nr:LPS assembly lipoprotein LptE [uncultured Photobacterium sp.]
MKSFFSANSLTRLLIITLLALTTASCGFHLRGNYMLPEGIAKLSLTSFDPYGQLTRMVKYQFKLHGIEEVKPAATVPNLNITSESTGDSTLSLYQNNGKAEYDLTLTVNYTVTIPNQGIEQFSTKVTRTFLDNPLSALAKSVERDELVNVMREQAAQQIMRKLARLTTVFNKMEEDKLNSELNQILHNQKVSIKDGSTTTITTTPAVIYKKQDNNAQ